MFYAASFRLSRLEITYPGHGARIDTATPTITGVAAPGTVVSLTMDPRRSGSTRALGTATAGDDHTWSLAVTAPLSTGQHIIAADIGGQKPRREHTFTVDLVGSPVDVANEDAVGRSLALSWAGTTVFMWAGHYAHVSMAAIDSSCVAFAGALQAAIVAAGFASATVTYDTSTHAYTLSNGGGSFTLSFAVGGAGTRMARILGFTSGATASSHTSTVRPIYLIVPRLDSRIGYTGLRRLQRSARHEADDGRLFVLRPTVVPMAAQWEHHHEPRAAVHAYAAGSSAPWTWEHLWEHAGPTQALIYISPEAGDPEPAGVWQLRTGDFDDSTHERQYRDADMSWRVRIDAVRLGTA